jgi:hypothetical protein
MLKGLAQYFGWAAWPFHARIAPIGWTKRPPSPNPMAAALVVMGNSIALDDPPIRVAEEFAILDVLSGGRLIASFGQSACLVQKQGTLLAMGSC